MSIRSGHAKPDGQPLGGGEHLATLNPQARLTMYGRELNDESYAICKADMLIKGQDEANIVAGNTPGQGLF